VDFEAALKPIRRDLVLLKLGVGLALMGQLVLLLFG
jgi:hypothetical protein